MLFGWYNDFIVILSKREQIVVVGKMATSHRVTKGGLRKLGVGAPQRAAGAAIADLW